MLVYNLDFIIEKKETVYIKDGEIIDFNGLSSQDRLFILLYGKGEGFDIQEKTEYKTIHKQAKTKKDCQYIIDNILKDFSEYTVYQKISN